MGAIVDTLTGNRTPISGLEDPCIIRYAMRAAPLLYNLCYIININCSYIAGSGRRDLRCRGRGGSRGGAGSHCVNRANSIIVLSFGGQARVSI